MKGKYFLDTNIFVYSFDSNSQKKKKKAQSLIETALSSNKGVISSQIIQEFINVATRKFTSSFSFQESLMYIDQVLQPLCEIFIDVEIIKQAVSIHSETKYSFYDSLVLSSAIQTKCAILYTEDLQHEQIVRGVKIKNPFI